MTTDADRYSIPIFPLENVVLFPRVKVPLHIFEPRYRQMTRDALDSNGQIGMAVVKPDQVDAMRDQPDLFEVGCLGQIEESNELPGGRFHVVLEGSARFRIEQESPPSAQRLYRLANVQILTDEHREEDKPLVIQLRVEIRSLMRQILTLVAPKRVELFEQQPVQQFDDETYVNMMSQSIDFVASEKQALLETNSVHDRYEKLAAFMRFRLAEIASGGAPGTNAVQ